MFRVHQFSSPLVSCRNNLFIREEVLAQWRELSPFSALILVRFSCTFSLFFVSLSFQGVGEGEVGDRCILITALIAN